MTYTAQKEDFQEKLALCRHKTNRNRRCEAARKEIIEMLKAEGRLDSYRHLIVFLSLDIPAVFEITEVAANWLGLGKSGMLDIFTEALDSYRDVFFTQESTRRHRMKMFAGALILAGTRRAEKSRKGREGRDDSEMLRVRLLQFLAKFYEKTPAICGIMDFRPADLFPGGAVRKKSAEEKSPGGKSAEILNLDGEDGR